LQQAVELDRARLHVGHRGVGQEGLHAAERLVGLARELVHLVEDPGPDRARKGVAAPGHVRRRPGDDVRGHAPEQAVRLDLAARVLRDLVLALDLEPHRHLALVDLELLDPADVHAAHLHGVALADPARVRDDGRDLVAAAEERGVGQREQRGQDRGDTQDHEDADEEVVVAAAEGGHRGERLFLAHGSSMILRAAASAAWRSAKARTSGSWLARNSRGVPTKRTLPWSRRAMRSEISSAPSMSWVTMIDV